MDHLIPVRIPDLVIRSKKEILPSNALYRPSGPLSENQRKRKKSPIFKPYKRTEKAVEHESDGETNYESCTWNGPQRGGLKS